MYYHATSCMTVMNVLTCNILHGGQECINLQHLAHPLGRCINDHDVVVDLSGVEKIYEHSKNDRNHWI